MGRARRAPTPPAPDCPLQGEAEPIACGGTLKERRTGAAVTARSPGRAYALDTPAGRALLGLDGSARCADGCVWMPDRAPPTLVFLELKGGSIHRAVEQLISVHDAADRRLQGLGCDLAMEFAVVMSGSAPPDQKRLKAEFKRHTGKVLRLHTGRRNAAVPVEGLLGLAR